MSIYIVTVSPDPGVDSGTNGAHSDQYDPNETISGTRNPSIDDVVSKYIEDSEQNRRVPNRRNIFSIVLSDTSKQAKTHFIVR